MPFDPSHPPAKLKNLSDKKKRQWIAVFNKCYSEDHDDEKCHKIAWSSVRTAHIQERVASISEKIAKDIEAGFLDDVKAMKMKARAMEFFQDVKNFRGEANDFIRDMMSFVKDPRALSAFPEIRDVIELGEFMKKGVLRHTFLSESDVEQKMQKVVELDA